MKLLGFQVSNKKNKKYDAIMDNNGRIKLISFGDKRYEHYFDKLGHYSHLNHNDKERRRLYRLRHQNDNLDEYSPGFFSWHILWWLISYQF